MEQQTNRTEAVIISDVSLKSLVQWEKAFLGAVLLPSFPSQFVLVLQAVRASHHYKSLLAAKRLLSER